MQDGEPPVLLDIREYFEFDISNIENSILIPLGELESRLDEIETYKDTEMAVICRTGNRSQRAIEVLKGHGFTRLWNLKGGINEWALKIDNSLPVY